MTALPSNLQSQQLRIQDQVVLRKKHPCGSNTWHVSKLGMDVVLRCNGCGRRLRFERHVLDRQIRRILGQPA